MDRRAGRHPHEHALLPGQPAGQREGVLLPDGPHLVDQVHVQVGRYETRPHPLELVVAPLLAAKHRAARRLDRHHPRRRPLRLQVAANPADGAARARTGHQRVDPALRLPPQLRARDPLVVGRIGGVLELVGHEPVQLQSQLLRPRDRAAHAQLAWRELDLRAVHPQRLHPLLACAVGEHDDAAVAANRSEEREAYPGVAGGRLDDHLPRAWAEDAPLLGILYEPQGRAVLYGASRIEALQLHPDLCHARFDNPEESYQRGVPHERVEHSWPACRVHDKSVAAATLLPSGAWGSMSCGSSSSRRRRPSRKGTRAWGPNRTGRVITWSVRWRATSNFRSRTSARRTRSSSPAS